MPREAPGEAPFMDFWFVDLCVQDLFQHFVRLLWKKDIEEFWWVSLSTCLFPPSKIRSFCMLLLVTACGLAVASRSWWHSDPKESKSEAKIASWILKMFHRGVLLLDEVCLLGVLSFFLLFFAFRKKDSIVDLSFWQGGRNQFNQSSTFF